MKQSCQEKPQHFLANEEQPFQPPQPAPAGLLPFYKWKVAEEESAVGLTHTARLTGRVILSLEDSAESGSPKHSEVVSVSGQR